MGVPCLNAGHHQISRAYLWSSIDRQVVNRRQFLAALGVAGVSGCLRLSSDGADGTASPGDGGSTATATPAPVTEPPSGETATETATPTDTPASVEITGEWPQFSADAANTGYRPEETGPVEGAVPRWRFDSGDLVVSSPAIANGRVFFTGYLEPGHLWAIDASGGTELWRQRVPGVDHIGAPAVAGDHVYVPTWNRADNRNQLYAIDAAGGGFVWEADLRGGAFGSPTVVGDTVYVGDGPVTDESNGHVVAVSTADGTERWRAEVTGVPLGTVAVADGTVYATSLTPSDFREYPSAPDWSASGFPPKRFFVFGNLDDEAHSSVATMDEAAGYVTAIDPAGPSVRWETTLPDFVVSGVAVVDDTVLVGCWDHNLYALGRDDGLERWTHATDAPISGQPSVANRTAYVGSWDRNVYAVSLADGQREWFYPVEGKVTSSPAVTDDSVYVAVDNDAVYGLSTDGRERFRFQGPRGDFNATSPAVADGAVVVCGDIAEREGGGERGGPFLLG